MYYLPGTDGYWYQYDPANGDSVKTSTRWDSLALTAVVDDNGTLIISKAGKEIWSFNDAVVLRAQSIVFHPVVWYGGIPATYASRVSYKPVTPRYAKGEANTVAQGDTVAGTQDTLAFAARTSSSNGLVMYFDFNPYGVKVPSVKELALRQWDKQYVDVSGFTKLEVKSAEKANFDGQNYVKVTAAFEGNAANVNKTVTTLQLEAYGNGKDTTVVSDYFAVIDKEVKDPVIAINKVAGNPADSAKWQRYSDVKVPEGKTIRDTLDVGVQYFLPGMFTYDTAADTTSLRGNKPSHLYQTVKEALADSAWIYVPYNDTLDLLTTHYDQAGSHVNDDQIEALGFDYIFELIGWEDGDNGTSQSAQSAIEGTNFIPALTSGGQQAGGTASRATIGREPLVRVLLKDNTTGKYAAAGYVKLHITDEIVGTVAPAEAIIRYTYGAPALTKDFEVMCPVDTISDTLKWWQIEENILHTIGLTKNEFMAQYTLDTIVNAADQKVAGEALQYKAAPVAGSENILLSTVNDAGTAVAAKHTADYLGWIFQTTTDSLGTMTEVLIWQVPYNEAYAKFKSGSTELKAIARYKNKLSASPYIYVIFSWEPAAIYVKPNAAISGQFEESWYKHNTQQHTAVEDLHANVEQAFASKFAGGETDCAFKFDILKTFTGNKVTPVITDKDVPAHTYTKLAGVATTFKFAPVAQQDPYYVADAKAMKVVGQDSTWYIRVVNDTALMAVNAKGIATDRKAGELADNKYTIRVATLDSSVVTLDSTSNAIKDILNKVDHYKFGDNESFQTKILATVADTCGNDITGGASFYVKYLRPLNVAPGTGDTLLDGRLGGADTVFFNSLVISDWRDTFKGTHDASRGLYDYNFTTDTDIDGKSGQDFLDYYGVDSIAADTNNITFNRVVNGTAYDITRDLVKTYDPALFLSLHYVAPAGGFSAGNYGGLALSNTGTTHAAYTIRVPLVVFYKWGQQKSYVDIVINATDGSNGKGARR